MYCNAVAVIFNLFMAAGRDWGGCHLSRDRPWSPNDDPPTDNDIIPQGLATNTYFYPAFDIVSNRSTDFFIQFGHKTYREILIIGPLDIKKIIYRDHLHGFKPSVDSLHPGSCIALCTIAVEIGGINYHANPDLERWKLSKYFVPWLMNSLEKKCRLDVCRNQHEK